MASFFLMPQAAFIPFLMAAKAALDAQSRPRTLAIPVIVRALTTPSTVSLTNSVETGITSAMSRASSAWSAPGPTTNPATEIMASTRGKNEKRA